MYDPKTESPNLRWLESTRNKCCHCGVRWAVGILRGVRNESYGPHCKSCANKRLRASEQVRKNPPKRKTLTMADIQDDMPERWRSRNG